MDYNLYYNNIHIINNFEVTQRLSCTGDKLALEEGSHSSVSQDITAIIINTLKWTFSKNRTQDELVCKNKVKKEMQPGGPLENIARSLNEIKATILDKDELQKFEELFKNITKLQNHEIRKNVSRATTHLEDFMDVWREDGVPTFKDGKIVAADSNDPNDEGLQEAQKKVTSGLESILWMLSNGSRFGIDLKDMLQNIDFGGIHDKWLYTLEAINKEDKHLISPEILKGVRALRLFQQQKIEEKIQWVNKTCPAMVDSINKMMLSRRILTHYSPFEDTKLDEIKRQLSLEKPKELIASTSYKVKTLKTNEQITNIQRASEDLIEKKSTDLDCQTELFAKPFLGEPDVYLSEVKLSYDDVKIDCVKLLPQNITLLGFQPGIGAIRERTAYKLQEAMGINFGVPDIVILDANFQEFNLDELAQELYAKGWTAEEDNPCHNPFTCFVKFIPNATSLDGDTENSILEEEAHKPLINTLLLNVDGHVNNCLVKEGQIIPIDFSYSLPIISESLDEIRGCKNLLIDIPVASKHMSQSVRDKLVNLDIENVVKIIREDVELHKKQFGDHCSFPESIYKILHLNLLLLKIGAELNKTPVEIDSVQCPVRRRSGTSVNFYGGEYLRIYQEYILGKSEVDWIKVSDKLKAILSLPFQERVTLDKGYSSLRLRKL